MIENGLYDSLTIDDAKRLGRAAPRSVEDAFGAEFDSQSDPWLKPILTAFAHAEGTGMPLRHARGVAQAISKRLLPPRSDIELRDLIAERARFYLKTDIDGDDSMLYALFHQALQQHLVTDSEKGDERGTIHRKLFSALSEELGYGDKRATGLANRWTPYIRRHFGAHAIQAGQIDEICSDPQYLAHGDHDQMMLAFRKAQSTAARRAASVYRASHSFHRDAEWRDRLLRLGLDAADLVMLNYSLRFVVRGDPRTTRWSTGLVAVSTAITDVRDVGSEVIAMTVAEIDGRPVVVCACGDGSLQIRTVSTGDLGPLRRSLPLRTVSCLHTSGRVSISHQRCSWKSQSGDLARAGCSSDRNSQQRISSAEHYFDRSSRPTCNGLAKGSIEVWDLATALKVRTLHGTRGGVRYLQCTNLAGRATVVASSDSGYIGMDISAEGCFIESADRLTPGR